MTAQIAIIGGGPAGATAAFHLATTGFQVTVFESQVFPRVKVCGEYISPAATDLLEAVVPATELVMSGARHVQEFVIEVNDRRLAWRTPKPAWALSRGALDTILLNKARAAGVTVLQPVSVQSVGYLDDRAKIRLSNGETREAHLVIHADGSGRHDPKGPVPMARGLVGHKCHLRAPTGAISGVTMRSCPGAYVGTISVEDGLGTCALVATKELTARFRSDADAMLTSLWPAYRPHWRTSEWKACGVARSGYIRPGHTRSIRIGNAAAAVDPVGGEGIGLALWAATRLASELNAAGSGVLDSSTCQACERSLAKAYRRRLLVRSIACRVAAAGLLRPRLISSLWPLLQLPSLTLHPWYRLTGKPAA